MIAKMSREVHEPTPRSHSEDIDVFFELEVEQSELVNSGPLQAHILQAATELWEPRSSINTQNEGLKLPEAFGAQALEFENERTTTKQLERWPEKRKRLISLIRDGRKSGFILESALVDVLLDAHLATHSFEAVRRVLADHGIDIVDSHPAVQLVSLVSPFCGGVTSREIVDTELSPERRIRTDDAFQLGRASNLELLSRDGERALAQAIAHSRDAWIKTVSCSPALLNSLQDVLESAQRGEIRPHDLFDLLNQKTDSEGTAHELESLLRDIEDGEDSNSDHDDGAGILTEAIAICSKLAKLIGSVRPSSDAQQARTELVRLLGNFRLSAFAMKRTLAACQPSGPDEAAMAKAVRHLEQVLEARRKLIEANFKLVLWIAKKYGWTNVPMDDLVQEGNIGLMKAADKFDGQKETKFSTYATWWVRQSIVRSLGNDSRTVRLPVHVHEAVVKVSRIASRLGGKGLSVSPEAISAEAGIPKNRVRQLLGLASEQLQYDPWQEEEPAESIDDEGTETVTKAETPHCDDASLYAERLDGTAKIQAVLAQLSSRDADVVRRRFGIGDDQDMTLEEVGRMYGVTRERIRQIEAKALKRLRHISRASLLADLLDNSEEALTMLRESREEE